MAVITTINENDQVSASRSVINENFNNLNEALETAGAVSSVNTKTGAVVLTTADIADSSNKRYVTDANLTTIGNQSGTNTGDNAVNTLYSGLVSNATHTGDATGSTALTVVGINGTSLAGLGTGILKNTTGTGVPSIAVAGDFPTLNQNTTGSAATLTTTRTIWGQNFNGSGNITGILKTSDITSLAGDNLTLSTPDATGGSSGTDMYIYVSNGNDTGTGGYFYLYAGNGGANGDGGQVTITAGDGGSSAGEGGDVNIVSGAATTYGAGNVNIYGGNSDSGDAGSVFIHGGETVSGGDGKVVLGNPGKVYIQQEGSSLHAILDASSITTENKTFTFPDTTGNIVVDTANQTLTNKILQPSAGTASANTAPIKLTSGTLLTTAEDGAIEMDDNCFYGTTDAGNRGVIPVEHIIRAGATRTFTSNTNQQAIFSSPASGTLTLETGAYLFEGLIAMTSMSATSGNGKFSLIGAGTATLGAILWQAYGGDVAAEGTAAAIGGSWHVIATQTAANVVTAGGGTSLCFLVKGTFEVTGAGTIIPSFAQTTSSAAVVSIGSYIKFNRIGSTSMTSVGQWT